jgi:hypothetical protein
LPTAAACLVVLSACVLRPDWQKLAIEGQLETRWLDTGRFRHLVLQNGVHGKHLRIYIEGDGGPWIRETRVSVDPTPTNPVLLRLMHGATHPAVYLGRPCYFGTATDEGCGPRLWTFDRYGQAIVDSMCEAANLVTREHEAESVQLIGYSGGGAIVVGMSGCTDRLISLTTVAGNLDPDAWARHHEYSPLRDLAPLVNALNTTNAIDESHWQCSDDLKIPPPITDKYFETRDGAARHIVDSCSHATGWERYWLQITGEDGNH